MVSFRDKENRLARKLMLAVILSSTLITILTTSYQLYGLYSRDISAIDTRLSEIESVMLDGISHDLWVADYGELSARIEGMAKIPDILYIKVRENDKSLIEIGSFNKEKVIQKRFDLKYFYRNKELKIGELLVQFSLQNVYDRLFNQLIDILISNTLKTFLIAFVILWIFYQLVTRHLQELAKHTTELTTENLDKEFSYSDKAVKTNMPDELDTVSNSINVMKRNMKISMQALENSRAKIKEKEIFYQSILDMNTAVIYVKNVDGRFIYINSEFENLFGADKVSIKNKTVHDLFDYQTAGMLVDNDTAVVKSRVPIEFVEVIPVNGKNHTYLSTRFPLKNEHGESYAYGCVSTDVTKLKSTESELSKKTREIEQVINSLIDGVITVNSDLTIADMNYAAEDILGYRSSELQGKSISVLVCDKDKEKFLMIQSTLTKLIKERMLGTSRELWAKRKNGEEFPLQLSVNAISEEKEKSQRFVASFIDLTEIKEKEKLLRQSMKLEALGKLTGGIAHDYNNMLGVIGGYTELMQMKLKDDPEYDDYLWQIAHATERGATLTKKLLGFSSAVNTQAEVIDLKQLIESMQDMLTKTLTVRIALSIHVEEGLWPVFTDKNELEDAILNICINAMHAMPDGGQLIIELKNVYIDPREAENFGLEAKDYVVLCIADTGKGMPEDIQSKIFDPFFTTKGDKGTGLGLSQVYGFMNRSGGTIKVRSMINVGSQFLMYFPRHEEMQVSNSITISSNESKQVVGSEKILVVEDEEALRLLLIEVLEGHGYQVDSAANGVEAIPLLEKQKYTLVLSDLLMPEMDGYRLSQYIRSNYPETKIQLLSGYHDKNDYEDLDESLRNTILNKPISNDTLLKKVRDILDT